MAHGEHYKPKPSLFPLYDAYVLFLYWNFVFLVSVLIVFFFSFDKVQVHAWPHTCTVHRVLWSATLLPLDLCLLTWCRNSKNLQLGTLFFSLTFTSAPSFIVQYLFFPFTSSRESSCERTLHKIRGHSYIQKVSMNGEFSEIWICKISPTAMILYARLGHSFVLIKPFNTYFIMAHQLSFLFYGRRGHINIRPIQHYISKSRWVFRPKIHYSHDWAFIILYFIFIVCFVIDKKKCTTK